MHCEDSEPRTPNMHNTSPCLNKYVLEVAAVGLKTKAKRSYTVLYNEGRTSESE